MVDNCWVCRYCSLQIVIMWRSVRLMRATTYMNGNTVKRHLQDDVLLPRTFWSKKEEVIENHSFIPWACYRIGGDKRQHNHGHGQAHAKKGVGAHSTFHSISINPQKINACIKMRQACYWCAFVNGTCFIRMSRKCLDCWCKKKMQILKENPLSTDKDTFTYHDLTYVCLVWV